MAQLPKLYEPFQPTTVGERPHVDSWEPQPEDIVFHTTKDAILMDVASFYHLQDQYPDLDTFNLSSKRAYNGETVKNHIAHYLNYFEKFYDFDHELLAIYASIKYLIDFEPSYGKDALFFDISRYFINRSSPIFIKLMQMNEDNYCLHLTYRNKKNPVLQYRDRHAKLLMLISVLMGMIIIPVCHFMKVRKIRKPNEFLIEIFDRLLLIDPNIDIYSKLMETASSSVHQSEQKNPEIFNRQDIRGLSSTIHSQNSVVNILINIIPKYRYSENIINLNFRSILNNTGWNIHQARRPYHSKGWLENSSNCWKWLKSLTLQQDIHSMTVTELDMDVIGSKKIRASSTRAIGLISSEA